MEFSGSVTQMIHRLRSDDPRVRDEAARLVWEHYFRDLLALAHRHLGYRIRHKVDRGGRVAGSMYASARRRQLRGDFELYGRDDFWRLLVTITLNKVRNTANWHLRAGASATYVASVPSPRTRGGPTSGKAGRSRSPVPRLTRPSPWPRSWNEGSARSKIPMIPCWRQVALKKLEGLTNKEIAEELDYTERTITHSKIPMIPCWSRWP